MKELNRVIILEAVLKERELQDSILKEQFDYTDEWWHVLTIEKNGHIAGEIYNKNKQKLFLEIVQVCAIYFAWAESILDESEGVHYEKER